ncbi:MAG: hypothetical protein AAFN59_04220 [Pseudomonadota bacterium]
MSILTLGTTTEAIGDEAGWDLLTSVKITEVGEGLDWRAEKTFSEDIRAAADAFQISGFVVPIVPEPYVQTFLLVAEPEDCPFCGSSGYGPVLEVHLKRPLAGLTEFAELTVRGQLELIDDPMTFQAYRLLEAIPVGPDG